MKALAIIVLPLLGACATLPEAQRLVKHEHAVADRSIHVVSHGWHTGVIVQTADLTRLMPVLAKRFPDAKSLEVGWGDAGFYQADKITAGLAIKALFWPTPTVVHVVGMDDEPERYFPYSEVRKVQVSSEGIDQLMRFLKSSFQTTAQGEVMRIRTGLYGDSQFYQGTGDYHLFNGCNKWTSKALYSSGFDIHPLFKLSSFSVMSEVR